MCWSQTNKYIDFVYIVHLGGGTWGIVSVPFLDSDYGLFYKGNILSMWLIGWNLCGLLVIIIWTLMWAALIFGIMSALNFLRVTSAVEKQGINARFYLALWS